MKLSGLESDLEPSPAEYEYLPDQESDQNGQQRSKPVNNIK
jgi:hypothetical protein